MVKRPHHVEEQKALNKGTVLNMTSIFGGLMLSGLIYLIGNWYIYGDELKRHDATLNKLSDTVASLSTTVAVLGEQNKQIASILEKVSGQIAQKGH